ncbi:GMC oxidoreductase [Arthrobacter castelli]|uniref:GMC oxidoreductase n=1 Tax=Arthrobacter castelli TaxID=271431 RepID=UPI00138AD945|nr:GMC family oxidoreductase [Arthrobacter castelli]
MKCAESTVNWPVNATTQQLSKGSSSDLKSFVDHPIRLQLSVLPLLSRSAQAETIVFRDSQSTRPPLVQSCTCDHSSIVVRTVMNPESTDPPDEASSAPASAPHVDAIVVGSGFGGAVTSARLAQAGFTVTVLERGRRWQPGQFPRSPQIREGWLWEAGRGLYDMRWLDSMLSIQAAGWGGGSLVYANVFARPSMDSLGKHWPEGLSRAELEPYYDLAGTMLEVNPVQVDPATGRVPDRTRVVEDLVEQMKIRSATIRPNLAVRFGPTDSWAPNEHGVPQRGCAFVGECILGCNRSAKNSLDHNYLAVAEKYSATAVTGAEVTRIERDEAGWAVWTNEGSGADEHQVRRTGTRLFLAAGAVSTTELLLSSRDVDRTLPRLSSTLGRGFSGNGDYLATSNLRRGHGNLTTGPTITTTTVLDVWERSKPVWFQVQDGAIPRAVSDLFDQSLPFQRLRSWWRRIRRHDVTRSIAFLSMGHDAGTGQLKLDDQGKAQLQWANRQQSRLYRAEGRVGPAVARIIGSGVRPAPLWSLFRKPITVHPLGGVPIGADGNSGVVGPDRQVHSYPGLYVMDGSVIPASTGANPSATILAGAESAIEGIIRDVTGDSSWQAPEWARVRRLPVPEDAAYRWMGTRRRETAGDGVVLDERMHERHPDGVGPGALQVQLKISGLDTFRTDPEHRLSVAGSIRVSAIPGTHAVEGQLRMFPQETSYLMRYDLWFTDGRGRNWIGIGVKSQRGRGPVAKYRGLTKLHLEIHPEDDTDTTIDTELILRPLDVMRNGGSIRGTGFTLARRQKAVLTFFTFFARKTVGSRRRRPGKRSRRLRR